MVRLFRLWKRPRRVEVKSRIPPLTKAAMLNNPKLLGNILRNEISGHNQVKEVLRGKDGILVTVGLKTAPAIQLLINKQGRVEVYGAMNKRDSQEYAKLVLDVTKIIEKRI